jgi:hypothetical protein
VTAVRSLCVADGYEIQVRSLVDVAGNAEEKTVTGCSVQHLQSDAGGRDRHGEQQQARSCWHGLLCVAVTAAVSESAASSGHWSAVSWEIRLNEFNKRLTVLPLLSQTGDGYAGVTYSVVDESECGWY